ncbi:MAG: stage V sporulation protein AA [Lachnospiraceae bacterium]|nr:stage V sporulation protein AA [Lachnospiraceae bacterium]
MAVQIFYLKADEKVELENKEIRLADVASVLCEDDRVQQKAQEMIVYRFSEEGRAVIDVLQLIALLQKRYPGCRVVSLGADAVLVECHTVKPHPVWEKIKIVLIALLCFFGAAFTIMAFHNDISIDDIFSKMYLLVTGMESDGFTALEISYSIGLAVGIIVFFNHIGTRRISKDPTPIEVQMRQYEGDVVTALVENANRENANRENASGENTNGKSVNAGGRSEP